ncbi:MAG: AtpZ/AtpI family protein [Candidatus Firestonebacteria bacterium]
MTDFKSLVKLGWASSIGMTLVVSIFVGLGFGIFLDDLFSSSPIFTLIFLILGIMAGFLNIFSGLNKIK